MSARRRTRGLAVLMALAVTALPSLESVQAEQARRTLHTYVQRTWRIVEPRTPFVDNWHIGAVCEHLEAVTRGEIPRLLINVPPGCAKSLIVSVFWPSWEWASDASLRYLVGSYSDSLTIRDNLRLRDVVLSPWYQRHFGARVQLRGDQNAKTRMNTTAGGWRIATSVGGRGIGEHPDRNIIDDPHNPKQAESDKQRQQANDWYDQTLSMRGASRNARFVIIMQRLHEQDLTGHLVERDGADWVHLCLPMRYEPKRMIVTPLGWTDPRTTPGELLWPALFPDKKLRQLERQLGSYGTAGQMQQRPSSAEGSIIKRRWIRYYAPEHPPSRRISEVAISVDPALKATQKHDYWAMQAWARVAADAFLLKQEHDRFETPEASRKLKDLVRWLRETYPSAPMTILIEPTAAGPEMIANLRRHMPGILATPADMDKARRLQVVSPYFESGNVFVPGAQLPDGSDYDRSRTPAWVASWVDELVSFPAKYDDQVDAATQVLRRFQAHAQTTSSGTAGGTSSGGEVY